MKAGIMFDNNTELDRTLSVSFIAETWCNYPSQFDDLSYDKQKELEAQGVNECDYDNREITLDMLPLSTKIRLRNLGYTEEQFNDCRHLIAKAKQWALTTGLPHNLVIDSKELAQWEMLRAFTEVVAFQ